MFYLKRSWQEISLKKRTAALFLLGLATAAGAVAARQEANAPLLPLPTGKTIAPQGEQTGVGNFPANMALSPDGKWLAVTDTGFRQQISILSAQDGHLVSQIPFILKSRKKEDITALYVGLAFGTGPATDAAHASFPLYVSRGPEDKISIYTVDADGQAADTGRSLADPSGIPTDAKGAHPNFIAGIALNSTGALCYATHNETDDDTKFKGSISILDTTANRVIGKAVTPGFPYAVVAVTKGNQKDKKIYVSSERDGVVSVVNVVDPANPHVIGAIKTGDHPIALLLNSAQDRLFAANAGSDTVSIINTLTDTVLQTVSLRGASHLPGVTPTGLALSKDESRLYVTLGDMNAVAVLSLDDKAAVDGLIPTGWYPTAVAVAPDGNHLFVANAKGVQARNPNSSNTGPDGAWGKYIENVLEGTVARIPVPTFKDLPRLTQIADTANTGRSTETLPATNIKHVIYVIKENRTYDQVLGDLPQGNGDSNLTLFGRNVTPNQHALAERFLLLDNFYCSAEVSADGWNWCTSGMGSEYTERNVPFNYSGRGRNYDYEGEVNGIPVDLFNMPNVAKASGGYIWERAAHKGLSYRNYGFFVASENVSDLNGKLLVKENAPVEKALAGHTDENFLRFAMDYPDSDAFLRHNCPQPAQRLRYGKFDAPDRFAEWKREFDSYVQKHNLPQFMMVRFPRDHTVGTRAGSLSPRAMVADNDYAVGELVEAVSKSPYWQDTALFIVEDDAQDGYDHVDAHRSIAFVISPHIMNSSVDHRFYNTDSILHTMEQLLNLEPMCQYDALAPVINDLVVQPTNNAPYTAILPAKEIIAETNAKTAYRSGDSAKLDFSRADRVPAGTMNDILWHSAKGEHVPEPPVRHTLPITSARQEHNDD